MRFGVNYIPARNWLHSWQDFDPDAVAEDLAAIAALGMDHLRVHCLWPLFQPDPTWVSPVALERLRTVVDLAGRNGLDVAVTVLNGWMSGTYFRPPWQSESMGIFTDPIALSAERLLIAEVVAAVGDRPNLLGIDIGNEPNVMQTFQGNAVTRDQGNAWLADLLGHCERLAPDGLHVAGVDHQPWLGDGSCFGRTELGRFGAASVVHSWVYFTGALERYGVDGLGTRQLARYLVEVARAFSADPTRPIWLQEIGVSTEWVPPQRLAGFAADLITDALPADPWGITWWCSHDIDRRFSNFVELEYDLGLLTVHNEVKPMGAAVAAAIAEARTIAPGPRPRTALVLADDRTPDLGFADTFIALVAEGVDPAVVLSSRTDPAALAARGIEEIVEA